MGNRAKTRCDRCYFHRRYRYAIRRYYLAYFWWHTNPIDSPQPKFPMYHEQDEDKSEDYVCRRCRKCRIKVSHYF